MPSDIRMPDGTIIRNVPDGTPRAEVEKRWRAASMDQKKASHPVFGPILSAASGFADMMTLGLDDEVQAARDTILPFGPNNPASGWSKGFGAAFRENHRRAQAQKDRLAQTNPKSSLAGQVAGAVLPAVLSGGGSLATAPRTGGALARTTRALGPTVASSAAYGFNSASGGVRERAKAVPKAVAMGVAGDLGGRALGKVASRVIGGQRVPKNVRLLADEGIVLTPGQRAGMGSLRNTFEDKVLGSLPFVGDVPAAAARRGENDLRVAVANRVLAPIGQSIQRGTPMNNEGIRAVQDIAGNAYDEAIAPLVLRMDDPMAASLDDIVTTAQREVGPDAAQQIGAYATYLKGRLAEGLTGEPLKREIQNLRGIAAGNMQKDAMLGSKFWDLHNVLDDGLARQSGANASQAYTNARETQALLNRMNDAASKSVDGEFGPTQLLQAARRRGYGTNTANVASGEARLMDLANAAADVMRNKTANSGTPGRAIAGGSLLTGAAGGAAMIDPVMGTATGASLLGYIPGIDRILQDMALNRPEPLRRAGEAITRANPYLGRLGMGGALGLLGR